MTEVEVQNEQPGIRFTTVEVYQRIKRRVPPLVLSPSSIGIFKQCRQRYKFLHIDKLGDQYTRPKPYFTMANHVHATLKDLLSLEPVESRTAATAARLLHRNWRRYRIGFRDRDDEARWAKKALAQVTAFVRCFDVSVKPVMLEELLQVEITHGLILQGRVDRVDREADGSLHIIDYKTGNEAEELDWTQLEVLSLILSKRLPWPVGKVSYLYLGTSAIHTRAISSQELRDLYFNILNLARQVRAEKKFRPTPGLWCGSCDFLSICPDNLRAEPLAQTGAQLEFWDDLDADYLLSLGCAKSL